MEVKGKEIVYILDPALKPIFATDLLLGQGKEAIMIDVIFRLNPSSLVLVQRLMVAPANFKRMVLAMKDRLEAYEKEHGPIDIDARRIVTPGTGEFKQ